MKQHQFQIALDGPSGAGKSTIAKAVAEKLGIDYIDTGAMYRAIGYKIKETNTPMQDKQKLAAMLADTVIDFQSGKTVLDGQDVSDKIRTPDMSRMASACSALPAVRQKLVELQRAMAAKKSVIMDGRDIATNVLTEAEYKIYLTASVEERARRRFRELAQKGEHVELSQVEEDIRKRDYDDSHRELNPLRKAPEAVEIDATCMSIQQVVDRILEMVGALV